MATTMHRDGGFFASGDPHGYHPVVVDDSCLTEEECREALLEAVNRPFDGKKYLTGKELKSMETAIAKIERKAKSPYLFSNGYRESRPARNKRFEFARLAQLRAYARRKYAGGRGIWYGDGNPFQRSSGG